MNKKEKLEIKKEMEARSGAEILKLAGCLDDVDSDVAELCLIVLPKEGHLISMAEFMEATQKMKDKLIENLTKHNNRTIQSALDYIHKYETTYPAVSGTRELIHFTEWLLKESKAD